MDVNIEIKVPNVGKFSKTLFMRFTNNVLNDEFYIVRQFSATCKDHIMESLKPTKPYKPAARAQMLPKNLEIVPGFRPSRYQMDPSDPVSELRVSYP